MSSTRSRWPTAPPTPRPASCGPSAAIPAAGAAPAGTTTRVSLAASGAQADRHAEFPRLSADGSVVAWMSEATNVVPGDTNGVSNVFVRDRRTGTTTRASVAAGGAQANGFSPAADADLLRRAHAAVAAGRVRAVDAAVRLVGAAPSRTGPFLRRP